MAEFAPEVVRLFAEKVRWLRSCNKKLSRLFSAGCICSESAANSRNDCNAEPCPQSGAGPSLFVTAHQPTAPPSPTNGHPAELAEGPEYARGTRRFYGLSMPVVFFITHPDVAIDPSVPVPDWYFENVACGNPTYKT
jgi:hypothetical protein